MTAGDGSIANADVTTVKVDSATNKFPITLTVIGLAGGGLILQNNAGDDLPATATNPVGDVKGTFATKIKGGKAFAITVKSQPTKPNQLCTVTVGTGNVVSGEVSSIVVNCTDTYTIGGTVSGLAGKGLVLQNNAGDDIAVNMNGSFAFAKTAFKGDQYAVTIRSQSTDPWQTCALTGDTGTVASDDITTVAVVCTTNQYSISGTITGLTGTGAVLQNNAGDDIKRDANGAFQFATSVASGAAYAVTITTQPVGGPPNARCVVKAGTNTGTVAGADVTSVAGTCAARILVGRLQGTAFYTVPVNGAMTDPNVLAACQLQWRGPFAVRRSKLGLHVHGRQLGDRQCMR